MLKVKIALALMLTAPPGSTSEPVEEANEITGKVVGILTADKTTISF